MGYTVKQAARELKITETGVRLLIYRGRLPAVRFGRQWMIRGNDLTRYKYAERRRPGRPKSKEG
jgi:excisionase family DNA binding protein